MLRSIALVLGFQVAGELLSRILHLPVPGTVIGMVLMLGAFLVKDNLIDQVRPTAGFLLSNLSLLFVPAGVGIMRHGARFASEGFGIAVTIIGSSLIAMAVCAYTILGVMKLMKLEDD